jgi:hypothetical protein
MKNLSNADIYKKIKNYIKAMNDLSIEYIIDIIFWDIETGENIKGYKIGQTAEFFDRYRYLLQSINNYININYIQKDKSLF